MAQFGVILRQSQPQTKEFANHHGRVAGGSSYFNIAALNAADKPSVKSRPKQAEFRIALVRAELHRSGQESRHRVQRGPIRILSSIDWQAAI